MKLKKKYRNTIAYRNGRYYNLEKLTEKEMLELIESNPKYAGYFEEDEKESEEE